MVSQRKYDRLLKIRSILETFPSYIKNFKKYKKIPTGILDELLQICFERTTDKRRYSTSLLHYVHLLRYTSAESYKILSEQLAPTSPLVF